jgi:Uma2 family endonuclease
MAASPQLTSRLEHYLRTTFRPDCDYVDGEIVERNVGEQEHALLQSLLATALNERRREWGCTALTEQRMRVFEGQYRIPDLCLIASDAPFERILTRPPLVCVEILSAEDRWARMTERFEDFRRMGVPALWAIDPQEGKAWVWLKENPEWQDTLTLYAPGTPVRIDLAPVFAELAERKARQ